MPVVVVLSCVAGLIGAGCVAIAAGRKPWACRTIYGASLVLSLVALAAALVQLLAGDAEPSAATLPLGLPWLGAHFRIDALAAFFLVTVNLGGAAASLYGFGIADERAPHRVLPFFPPFSPA
jgi:hydrogenase-4 component B